MADLSVECEGPNCLSYCKKFYHDWFNLTRLRFGHKVQKYCETLHICLAGHDSAKICFWKSAKSKIYYFWKLFEYWSTIDSCDYWHYETCTFLITDHQKMHYSFWSNLLYLLVLPTSLLVSVLSVMTRSWGHQSWTCPFGFSFDRSGERRREIVYRIAKAGIFCYD